jgi:hypothetical protein
MSTVKHLIALTSLLLAPFARAQQTASPAATVRDHLWLFGYPPDGDAGYLENAGLRGGSSMTLVEGAHCPGGRTPQAHL